MHVSHLSYLLGRLEGGTGGDGRGRSGYSTSSDSRNGKADGKSISSSVVTDLAPPGAIIVNELAPILDACSEFGLTSGPFTAQLGIDTKASSNRYRQLGRKALLHSCRIVSVDKMVRVPTIVHAR